MKFATALTLTLLSAAVVAFAGDESEEQSDEVTCTLSGPDRQDRQGVLDRLGDGMVERKELDDGFAFGFPAENEWLTAITEVVALERKCCSFFTFRIVVEAGSGPIWLELSGPEGTKEFLSSQLGP
jgi:hypothetical protein